VSGEVNILKEFSVYFSQVSQPNTHNAELRYEAKIREFLTSHTTSNSAGIAKFIDIDLIHECVSDLKPHKAAGHDGVYNEHLIFGGPQLEVHLCLLFNAMLRHSYVPNDFRFGVIKPLLKCKNGDQSNLNMYRGIIP